MHGEAECRKFDEMLRGANSDQDWDQMAVDWCQHVDGVTIFPKLPVYLRTHHTSWTRNQRVKEAVRKAAPGEEVLKRINEKTRQELLAAPPAAAMDVDVGAAVETPAGGGSSYFKGVRNESTSGDAMPWRASIKMDGVQVDLGRFVPEAAAARAYDARAHVLGRPLNFPSGRFLAIAQHAPMQPAVRPVESDGALMVGGVNVGGQLPVPKKRKNGERSGDSKTRAPRSCSVCAASGRPGASVCKGRSGRGTCLFGAAGAGGGP